MNATLLGTLALLAPAVVIAWTALWRRHRPVFWGTLALIAVGLGYLVATGAAHDIGIAVGGTPADSAPPAR
jgi:hypothetical protein